VTSTRLTLPETKLKTDAMLYTNLKHIESAAELTQIVTENESVVVICGRMDPVCIPVFRIAEALETEFVNVKFFDMEFDNPESDIIRTSSEVIGFSSVPFVLYYRSGSIVKATSGAQTQTQITGILNLEFVATVNA
jgi:thioredoxin 1